MASLSVLRAQSPARLLVIFDAAGMVTPATRASAIGEAARIWRRYNVSLVTDADTDCDANTVTVRLDTGSDPQAGDAGLGDITFRPDGSPESSITLHLDAVTRIATSSPIMGLHPALWPAGLRDEIIARALGRALAHEIGHYLLRSPHHANSGLMQARQDSAMLGSPSEHQFGLTATDRDRLRIALAAPLLASARPVTLPSVCPIVASR